MGTGVVIRDHNGVCLAACCERTDEVVAPEVAEDLALIKFAGEEGFEKVIISSDCLSVVQRVLSHGADRYRVRASDL
jgi:hypothetical protein